jgi:hypothetical protein
MDKKEMMDKFVSWLYDMTEEEYDYIMQNATCTGPADGVHRQPPNLLPGLKFIFNYCKCMRLEDNPDNLKEPFVIVLGDRVGYFDGIGFQFYTGEVTDDGIPILNDDYFAICLDDLEHIVESIWIRIPQLEIEKFMFDNIIN